ncbi:B3 domain-containing protein At3g19184-like [Hibiscus syriacus]|uniref:B3 domain-containing protein At3g19184-like n=1 Tax=Hibiscus syriacus TaxID=106335 RepID=UPI001920E8AA|nr:B3 domain-containing protein At3g19184-like [Hibiscus syriacus]
MLQSHVTGGFWLGFPLQFCKKNLPHHDVTVTLVDEEGEEFEAKYLGGKNGLSAGRRGFAVDHNLVDGDALVFQMVAPTEFKVYILRAYGSKEDRRGQGNEDAAVDEDNKEVDGEPDVQNRGSKRIRARK